MRSAWWVGLCAAACGGPIEGTWVGSVECGGLDFDWEMTLDKEEGQTFAGKGVQQRQFVNASAQQVDEVTDFSVELTMDGKKAQDLRTTLACIDYVQAVTPAGGGDREILTQGCEPLRYKDWVIGWDGEEDMTIDGANSSCAGEIRLR